ncbi:MAG: DUF1292 domain-containing protein [Firmicutes bacterium]|nr:DUF1292 domain-containing protein [Bacillota bacterium]
MEEKLFTVIDEDGTEVEYEVVLTFKSEEFAKSYVVYKLPGDENEEVFAAIFDEDNTDGGNLIQVETEAEWDMLDEVLNAFLEDSDDADDEEESEEDEQK